MLDANASNPKHSKLDSLELGVGVVWKYIKNVNLNGAHGSLVDAKAQSDIILNPSFVPYLNKTQSIVPIYEIFTKTEVREIKKKIEPEMIAIVQNISPVFALIGIISESSVGYLTEYFIHVLLWFFTVQR